MKAVAELVGDLPRGKNLNPPRPRRKTQAAFEGTPIYDETLREAMIEKVDMPQVKQILNDIRDEKITVTTITQEKPSPLVDSLKAKVQYLRTIRIPEQTVVCI